MLSRVNLRNYRSYTKNNFEFNTGVNAVIGLNGSGKTNLLEAVSVLYTGRSYRASDEDLIAFDSDWARVDGIFQDDHTRALKLQKRASLLEKTYLLDGHEKKRLSKYDQLPSVLFEPNHLQLLIRGPEYRRSFIDELIAKMNPTHRTSLGKYAKALAQRNALLKRDGLQKDQLFIWNLKLTEFATDIIKARLEMIDTLNHELSHIYSQISGAKSTVKLSYQTTVTTDDYSNQLLKVLESKLGTDHARGFTSVGPHRDDVLFWLNGENAALSASRGEVRSLLLSLKVFEGQQLKNHFDKPPTLLLDDVFSELDEHRQTSLVEYFTESQVIITTTNINALIRGVSGKIIEL